jgi:hypothetical protein
MYSNFDLPLSNDFRSLQIFKILLLPKSPLNQLINEGTNKIFFSCHLASVTITLC